MIHNELFNYVFSSGAMSELLNAQCNAKIWIDSIDSVLQNTRYTKGQLLLNMGQMPDHIFFLEKGAVRAYYYDEEGKQCTFYLWDEFSIITDIVNYIEKTPSDLYIEVCENANMLLITRIALDKIINEFPESVLFLNSILLHYTRHHRERDKESQVMTANERLIKLVKIDKKIEQKFSRQWIASYLGMSRSWLYDLKSRKS